MKIAVITPFYQTPKPWLDQCLESVRNQTIPCTHFLVSDGDLNGDWESCEQLQFIKLAQPHANNGNTPRAVGSICAISQGYDAIAYLDSDNWYQSNHLETLVQLHQETGAVVCTSSRTLHHVDGTLLGLSLTDDGEIFADTSCLFLTRAAFGVVSVWYLMPQVYAAGCDRVFWDNIKAWNFSHAHTNLPTVAFRTRYKSDYDFFDVEPPEDLKENLQWPPGNTPGLPIWSPSFIQRYQPPQFPEPLAKKKLIEAIIFPISLQDINLIIFPNWHQPEELILENFVQILNQFHQNNLTILIAADQFEAEASLILSTVSFNLALQDQVEPDIQVLTNLRNRQWEALLTWAENYPVTELKSDNFENWDIKILNLLN